MKRLTLLLLAVLGYAQTNLTGYWVFRAPRANNDGTFAETFFELKQEGDIVTGRALQGTRETLISEGTFQGGTLHFVVSVAGRGGNPNRTVYDGKVSGGGAIALTRAGPVSYTHLDVYKRQELSSRREHRYNERKRTWRTHSTRY